MLFFSVTVTEYRYVPALAPVPAATFAPNSPPQPVDRPVLAPLPAVSLAPNSSPPPADRHVEAPFPAASLIPNPQPQPIEKAPPAERPGIHLLLSFMAILVFWGASSTLFFS